MKTLKGNIFDIQSFSVHDGPGCRTTVFLAGCPLKCAWCANPESWQMKKHLMYARNACKWEQGCNVCGDVCPHGAIRLRKDACPEINRSLCADCTEFKCVEICPNKALKQCVKEYTVDELVKILRRDFSSWGAEGGVTFSGGDPMVQHEFLVEVLKECRKMGIHTAIETSGCFDSQVFMEVIKYIDFAFIDVKHMDSKIHCEGTGVGNEQILSNIQSLASGGWNGRLVLRQPVISGYNDSEENAYKLIEFMKKNGLYEINLLKFHRMGQTKWEQLDKDYQYSSSGDVTEDQLLRLQSLYLDEGIACYIGNNTPF